MVSPPEAAATAPPPGPGSAARQGRIGRVRPRPVARSRPARSATTPPRNRLAETAGPEPGIPPALVRLVVGTVVGPHGVGGELKLRLATDAPEHLREIDRIFLGEETRPRRLLGVRFHGGQALLRVQGISSRDAAEALRGVPLRIAGTDARPLAPGEFFLYQLIGLEAVDETGASLGRVTDVMETGAHDVFVVSPPDGGPDLLLPNHPTVVLDIRPTEGRMTVRPLVYD